MKALPNINDEAAMLMRGKQSAIGAARNDAAAALRDACTGIQGATWDSVETEIDKATSALERLKTLAAMWKELN